eukprot:3152004-Pleurochrysis_carterae.AAC.2
MTHAQPSVSWLLRYHHALADRTAAVRCVNASRSLRRRRNVCAAGFAGEGANPCALPRSSHTLRPCLFACSC